MGCDGREESPVAGVVKGLTADRGWEGLLVSKRRGRRDETNKARLL